MRSRRDALLPLLLVVGASLAYHHGQKALPRAAHPLSAALVIHAVAAPAGVWLVNRR